MRAFTIGWLVAGCSFNPPRIDDDGVPIEPDASIAIDAAFACPMSYTIKFAQHSYRIVDDFGTFEESRASCASEGGHLIKIDDAAENAEVERQMEEAFGFSFNLWIGLSDPVNTAAYQWFDGTLPTTFVNWDQVPDASSNDCATIRSRSGGGRWFTNSCDTQLIAVCECHGP